MKTKTLIAALLFFGIAACKKETTFTNNPGADDLHNKAVGFSANQLLSSGTYKSLKIEVQYMTGYAPDAAALNHLQSMLAGLVNKTGGISIVTREIPASTNLSLSVNDLISIEKNNRTVFTNGSELGV